MNSTNSSSPLASSPPAISTTSMLSNFLKNCFLTLPRTILTYLAFCGIILMAYVIFRIVKYLLSGGEISSQGKDKNGSSGKDKNGSSGKDKNGSSGKDKNGSSGNDKNGSSGKDKNESSGNDKNGSSGKENNESSGKEKKWVIRKW